MRRWLCATLLAGVSALLLAVPNGAAVANPPGPSVRDPERYNSTGTGWWYLVNVNRAGIDTFLNNHNARNFNVEVLGPDAYSMIALPNAGVYSRTPAGSSSWTANETYASLVSKINTGLRLLDIERTVVNGETRYSATWVENTGAAAKAWWWWLGLTPGEISTKLGDCGCRLIDIDPIGGGRYDVIMIRNAGVDALGWWWYFGVSQNGVLQRLLDNNARPVDVEPDGTGRFAVLMVRDDLRGSVRFDQTWEDVTSGPPFGRYIHIKRYTTVSGTSRYLTVYQQNG